jgi:hypothetical protein
MTGVSYAECYNYALYAKCHYAECRGAVFETASSAPVSKNIFRTKTYHQIA